MSAEDKPKKKQRHKYRPPVKTFALRICLDDEQIIRTLGGGRLSRGVRYLTRLYRDRQMHSRRLFRYVEDWRLLVHKPYVDILKHCDCQHKAVDLPTQDAWAELTIAGRMHFFWAMTQHFFTVLKPLLPVIPLAERFVVQSVMMALPEYVRKQPIDLPAMEAAFLTYVFDGAVQPLLGWLYHDQSVPTHIHVVSLCCAAIVAMLAVLQAPHNLLADWDATKETMDALAYLRNDIGPTLAQDLLSCVGIR